MYGSNTIKRRRYHDYKRDRINIPDYDLYNPKPYSGDIKAGYYTEAKVKNLLKKNKDNPEALQAIDLDVIGAFTYPLSRQMGIAAEARGYLNRCFQVLKER